MEYKANFSQPNPSSRDSLQPSMNEETSLQPQSSESDDGARFNPVLSILKLDFLPTLAARTRRASADCVEDLKAPVEPVAVEPLVFGSYHALFPIRFQDGLRWILKIPACGTQEEFNASAAAALRSEVFTMKLIKRETTIPIPEIFAFSSTLDNELGVPYILMEFLPGKNAYDCWFDMKISKEERMLLRKNTLHDIARAMAQLSRFSFSTGGALMYDANGDLVGPGPMRLVDHEAMLERPSQLDDGDPKPTLYVDAGPFAHPQDYYLFWLDRGPEPRNLTLKGMHRLLRLFLQWVPEPQHPVFVLAHPDLNFQNILVSEDGRVQGFIDWDGVAAVPRLVGNERYPSWLTRDWDPVMYAWKEEMERGIEQNTLWEDSPATLISHRGEYNDFMSQYLSVQKQSPASCASAVKESTVTQRSLYVENLLIATDSSICVDGILSTFFEKIVQLGRESSLDSTSDEYDELDIYELASYFITDVVGRELADQNLVEFLQEGFSKLLNTTTV